MSMADPQTSIMELSIADIHARFAQGLLTCTDLTQRLLQLGEEQLERNGVLSHATGFPAITFPGGFSRPTRSAPLGVPIGIK